MDLLFINLRATGFSMPEQRNGKLDSAHTAGASKAAMWNCPQNAVWKHLEDGKKATSPFIYVDVRHPKEIDWKSDIRNVTEIWGIPGDKFISPELVERGKWKRNTQLLLKSLTWVLQGGQTCLRFSMGSLPHLARSRKWPLATFRSAKKQKGNAEYIPFSSLQNEENEIGRGSKLITWRGRWRQLSFQTTACRPSPHLAWWRPCWWQCHSWKANFLPFPSNSGKGVCTYPSRPWRVVLVPPWRTNLRINLTSERMETRVKSSFTSKGSSQFLLGVVYKRSSRFAERFRCSTTS